MWLTKEVLISLSLPKNDFDSMFELGDGDLSLLLNLFKKFWRDVGEPVLLFWFWWVSVDTLCKELTEDDEELLLMDDTFLGECRCLALLLLGWCDISSPTLLSLLELELRLLLSFFMLIISCWKIFFVIALSALFSGRPTIYDDSDDVAPMFWTSNWQPNNKIKLQSIEPETTIQTINIKQNSCQCKCVVSTCEMGA